MLPREYRARIIARCRRREGAMPVALGMDDDSRAAYIHAPMLITLDDYEAAARERIPAPAWEYIQSGAGDEHTLRWNRDGYASIALNPRVLTDVAQVDTRITLFGQHLAHPILLAPVAAQSIVHPEGEVATAIGAREADAGMVLSSYTSRTIEDVAAAGPRPLWFQLYMQDRERTRDVIHRAADSGCTALCLTVDTPTLGARDRMSRSGFTYPHLPYRTKEPGDNACTWDDVAWAQATASIPLLLKGVLHPDDAELAVQAGGPGDVGPKNRAGNPHIPPARATV